MIWVRRVQLIQELSQWSFRSNSCTCEEQILLLPQRWSLNFLSDVLHAWFVCTNAGVWHFDRMLLGAWRSDGYTHLDQNFKVIKQWINQSLDVVFEKVWLRNKFYCCAVRLTVAEEPWYGMCGQKALDGAEECIQALGVVLATVT